MKLGVLADVISCLKTLSFGTPTPGKHSPEKSNFSTENSTWVTLQQNHRA